MNIRLNGHLTWGGETILDEPGQWEVTARLAGGPPRPECTVNLTARRCRRFQAAAGGKFAWTNTQLLTAEQKRTQVEAGQTPRQERLIQPGLAEADRGGLVTIRQIRLTTARRRVVIRRL